MNIAQQYKELASKLGDIYYKLQILKQQEAEVIEQIKQLDHVAGLLKGANEKLKANPAGSNSPS